MTELPGAGNLKLQTPRWEKSSPNLPNSYSNFMLQKYRTFGSFCAGKKISTNRRTLWNLCGNCQFLCVNFKDVWCCDLPSKVRKLWTFCNEHVMNGSFSSGVESMRLSQWSNFKLIGEIQVFCFNMWGSKWLSGPLFFWIVTATGQKILEHRTWIWPTTWWVKGQDPTNNTLILLGGHLP